MVNYTIQPVLWDYEKNKKNIYTIKLMVTVNRKQTYLLTPHRVHSDHWDEKQREVTGHVNAKDINANIRKRIADKELEFIKAERQGIAITKSIIKGGINAAAKTFVSFAREVRDHRTELPRFINFAGEGFLLSEIDPSFLRKFAAHELSRTTKKEKKGVSKNTLSGTMKYINQIMRQAKKEKLIIDNPFDAYKAPKYINPVRVWLFEEEKQLLFKWLEKDQDPIFRATATYFLLACYSGIRHSDWAKFNPDTMVNGGFLRLRTTKNNVDVVMPIGPTLMKVIDMVKEVGRPYSLEKCNEHLKVIGPAAGIKKKISTHIGRHSFGYWCASIGLPKSTTAELMGITVQTVEIYYHLSGHNITKQAAILSTL